MKKRGDRIPVIGCLFIARLETIRPKRTLGKVYITYLIGHLQFRKIQGCPILIHLPPSAKGIPKE